MEDVAKLVDRILVMDNSEIVMDGVPREIFKSADELEKIGLGIPEITSFMRAFKAKGNDVSTDILTVAEAKDEIIRYLRSKNHA